VTLYNVHIKITVFSKYNIHKYSVIESHFVYISLLTRPHIWGILMWEASLHLVHSVINAALNTICETPNKYILQQGRYLHLSLYQKALAVTICHVWYELPLQMLVPGSVLKACNCTIRRIHCYNSNSVCLGPLVWPLHIVARVQCTRFLWLKLSAPESSKVYACDKQVWFSFHNKW
jgi:hypothetical protein